MIQVGFAYPATFEEQRMHLLLQAKHQQPLQNLPTKRMAYTGDEGRDAHPAKQVTRMRLTGSDMTRNLLQNICLQ